MCISHTYGRYLREGNGTPLQCSCLENPRDGGAWWAAICRVAQSRTRLKRLSSSSSRSREIPMGWPYLWVSHRCVSHSYGRYLWVSHTCGLAIPMGWPYLWVSHTYGRYLWVNNEMYYGGLLLFLPCTSFLLKKILGYNLNPRMMNPFLFSDLKKKPYYV